MASVTGYDWRWEAKIKSWVDTKYPQKLQERHFQLRAQRWAESEGVTADSFFCDVKAWLKDGTKMIYWAQGPPGSGKSMAVNALLEYLLPKDAARDVGLNGMSIIYFKWEEQLRQDWAGTFAYVLYQLQSCGSAYLKDALEQLYAEDYRGSGKHLLYQAPLVLLRKTPEKGVPYLTWQPTNPRAMRPPENPQERLLLIFDGLDEASDSFRQDFRAFVERLDPAVFRVLITSRENLRPSESDVTLVRHFTSNMQELRLYVSRRLSHVCEFFKSGNERPGFDDELNTLTEKVVETCDGLWFRAALVVAEVMKFARYDGALELAGDHFDYLDHVYERALNQIRSSQNSSNPPLKTLACIAFADGPVTGAQVSKAEAGIKQQENIDGDMIYQVDKICEQCRGLVTMQGTDSKHCTLQVAHPTIRDYLRSIPAIQQYRDRAP